MSDEQMIYVEPEDDLTNVRGRLEQIPTRRVTLVIPSQTQLRSHVAWKLLHARARELGKDVLIISSDPQIRSVAQAVKFRVAHSLESSQASKSRPANRSGRTSPVNRTRNASSQSRTPPGRGTTEQRGTGGPRARQANANQSAQWDSPTLEPPSTQGAKSRGSRESEAGRGETNDPISSTFDAAHPQYGQPYDYRVDTAPPIHPLSPQHIEEEPNLLDEDFHQAQDIRQAARQGSDSGVLPQPPLTPGPTSPFRESSQIYRTTPLAGDSEEEDPFAELDDSHPSPRAEQRGSVPVNGFDTSEHPIPDYPTDVRDGEIEYQGDQGDFVEPVNRTSSAYSSAEPSVEDEQDEAGPSRIYNVRPRGRTRTGKVPPLSAQQDFESDDALPPIDERPTQVTRQPPQVPTARSSATSPAPPPAPLPANNRAPQNTSTGRSRGILSRPNADPRQVTRQPMSPSRAGTFTGTQPRPSARKPARQKTNTGFSLFLPIILVFLGLVGAFAFFGPSADVTIALAARDFSRPLTLTATSRGQQNGALATVPADTLSQVFSKTGDGKATGSTKVGTGFATGTIIFTNTGSAAVDIPTGTMVATQNGIQFLTTADAYANTAGSTVGNSVQTLIQAQKPGESSNVPSSSIIVIPTDSLNAIAQYNKVAGTDLKLAVTNPDATSGGGASAATSITQQDIDSEKTALGAQVQGDINSWLKQHLAAGDVPGKPFVTATAVNAPPVGKIADGGTFTEKVTFTATVLVVRNANLQKASVAQLNTLLSKEKAYSGYTVVSDTKQPVNVQQMKPTSKSDGTTLTLNFIAAGKIVPNLSKQTVQSLIVGKPVSDAKLILSRIGNVQDVSIDTSPQISTWKPGWIPFWTGHINVKIVPGVVPTLPKNPPKKK